MFRFCSCFGVVICTAVFYFMSLNGVGKSVFAGVPEMKGAMSFQVPEQTHYKFEDVVGERIKNNLEQWLLPAPIANPGIIEMFRVRDRLPQPYLMDWTGEFVGKYLISAIQARRMINDDRLDDMIFWVIRELIETQAEDGYMGPFRSDDRLMGRWDLWGHYHIMMALMMWYESTGDNDSLACVIRAADLICDVYLDGDRRPIDAGWAEMNLSVLHGFGRLYRLTGDERYLRMMNVILEDMEEPEAGDYFRLGLAGVPFYKTPKPRWESLHAIQGLVELYRITGNTDFKAAFESHWYTIQAYDLHNSGAFSTDEQAVGSPYRTGAVETCCHVAWTYMSIDMLALTGDAKVADTLETGFWNAILGYQHPSGRWSTYHTPSNGVREASAHSIVFQAKHGTPELNCCSVNAPRGLGMLSEWAVMHEGDDTIILNFYGPMQATIPLDEDNLLRIEQVTRYPRDGHVKLEINPDVAVSFKMKLRIPAWSTTTTVHVNGEEVSGIQPGTYLALDREWVEGDVVDIQLDMSLRTWVGDEERDGTVSLYYGPLLLAFDQKYNIFDTVAIPALSGTQLGYEMLQERNTLFEPLLRLGFTVASGEHLELIDFAHAGVYGTHYASWLPAVEMPPAQFRLLGPDNMAQLPMGPNRFTWTGPSLTETKSYSLLIAASPSMAEPVIEVHGINASNTLCDLSLNPDTVWYWTAQAQNDHGKEIAVNGPQSFTLDTNLENPFLRNPALVQYRGDGLVTGAYLNGDGNPVYGFLDRAASVTSAQDRHGNPDAALRFHGNSMLRYQIPTFPHTEYSLVMWVRPEGQPAGHVRQLFSAWARSMDDPLRVYLRNTELFVGIEGSTGASLGGITIPFDTWSHVGVVKQGRLLRLFVNGELRAETDAAPQSLSSTMAENFALGANPNHPADEYFTGCIGEFALYAKMLSATDIKEIYNNGLELEK